MAWHLRQMTAGAWCVLIGIVIIVTAAVSLFLSAKILIGVGFAVGFFGIYKDLKEKETGETQKCPICKQEFHNSKYTYESQGFINVPILGSDLEGEDREIRYFSGWAPSAKMAEGKAKAHLKTRGIHNKLIRIAWIKAVEITERNDGKSD